MVDYSSLQYSLFLLSSSVTMLISGFLALIVIYKNYRNEINQVFFFWMVVSALNAFFVFTGTLFNSLALFEIGVFLSLVDPCIALHFILLYSIGNKWISHRLTTFLIYIPLFVAIPIMIYYRNVSVGSFGLLAGTYSLIMIGIVFLSLFLLLVTYFKTREKLKRSQLMFIGIGILIMTGGTFLPQMVYLLQPFFSYFTLTLVSYLIMFVAIPLSSIILTFTVLKFQLMGVESILRKGAVYSIISFIVVSLFILMGEVLEKVFENVNLLGLKVPGILTAVLIALLILPLQGRIEKIVNKVFPKKEDEHIRQIRLDTYRTALEDAMEDEILTRKEEKLLDTLRDSLEISSKDDKRLRKEVRDNRK
jgi:hypothetical protein